MTPNTTGTAQAAKIHVFRVREELGSPGSVLVELTGMDAYGAPASVVAVFDARHLSDQLFPGVVNCALEAAVDTVRIRALEKLDQPPSTKRLLLLAQTDICGSRIADLLKFASFLTEVKRDLVQTLCFSIGEEASRSAREPPAPAPAESEPGSPPRDDGASLADRVSNSMTGAGGGDTPLPEHSLERGGVLA